MGSCTADEGFVPTMEDLHPLVHTGGYPPLCSIDTRLDYRLHLRMFACPAWYFQKNSPHPSLPVGDFLMEYLLGHTVWLLLRIHI